MINETEGLAFDTFLEAVAAQWNYSPPVPKPGVILVDLSHDWIEYLLHSLLIAKQIQVETSWVILGICVETSVVSQSCPNFSRTAVKKLASSFGVDQIISMSANEIYGDFDYGVSADIETISEMAKRSSRGDDIREMLHDGSHIFTCAYESTLRSALIPTSSSFDRNILNALLEANKVDHNIAKLFESHDIRAIVSGHLDYNPWRIVCHHAANRAIPIYNFFSGCSLSLWKLVPRSGEKLGAAKGRVTAETFDKYCDKMDGDWAYQHSTFVVPTNGETTSSYALAMPHGRALARRHLERNGYWQDGKPVISIFAHTFSDIPRSDEQIFLDHAEWIEETLKFAAGISHRNWLVRAHPLDDVYDRTGFFQKLRERYSSYENIRFMTGREPLIEAFCMSDLIVTVRGTVGVEAIAAGIPCVLAGEGPYSKAGFVQACRTKDSYFAQLESEPIVPVLIEDVIRARNYLRFEATVADLYPGVLPPIRSSHSDREAYLRTATRMVARHSISSDGFAGAVSDLVKGGEARAVRTMNNAGPTRSKSAQASSDTLYFTAGRNGSRSIIAGFNEVEMMGTWQGMKRCAVLLPWPAQSICRLRLVGHKLCEQQEIYIRTLSGGKLPLNMPWAGDSLVSVEVDVQHMLEGEGDVTLLEFEINTTFSPFSLGLNEDKRQLGLYLYSIGTELA